MKRIKLTKGKYTKVNNSDFEYLNQWKWFCLNPGYAARSIRIGKKVNKILMHRLLLKPQKNQEIDHINGDKLDNRRKNLRICIGAENRRNRGLNKSNTSGYKGVSWHKRSNKWTAKITFNGKTFYLGYFNNKKYASRTYNKACQKYHREFANLNKE